MPVSITAIIPNWNGAGLLIKALAALSRQTTPVEQVLVVDNGSSDNSVEVARSAGAGVIAFDRNEGFARAVNRGVQEAHGDWLLILNNDVELRPDWIEKMLGSLREHAAWFAAGKLLGPTAMDGAFDALCRGGCAWRCGAGRPDGPVWNEQREIRFAPLTAALFRSDVFRKIGYLDEEFESYLEDIDFGLRCAESGLAGVYVPDAIAYHRGSATLGRWHPDTVRRMARNQVLLVAKHYPRRWIGAFGRQVFVAQTLWGLVALRHGAGWAFVRGKWEGLRRFRGARRAGPDSVASILRDSEQEILDLQRRTGFDWYWRLYFALT
jgi:GT2 family glycosyltransferase